MSLKCREYVAPLYMNYKFFIEFDIAEFITCWGYKVGMGACKIL